MGANVTGSSNEYYAQPGVLAQYKSEEALQPGESMIFQKCIRPHSEILDLGVGAGRTTRHLLPNSSRYVGVDISPAMIAACRELFPNVKFEVGDAARLSAFEDSSFDVVLFSFNGIDHLSDGDRIACIGEARRVLRPKGVLIFSTHNARQLFFAPRLEGCSIARKGWRVIYAMYRTARLAPLRIMSRTFWRGEGKLRDPYVAGQLLHLSIPSVVSNEVGRVGGFRLDTVIPAFGRELAERISTPWFYYAFTKE